MARDTAARPRSLCRDGRGLHLNIPEFDLTLRWLEANQLDDWEFGRILALLRRAFNGGPSWFHLGVSPEEHLRWKALDLPGTCQIRLTETDQGAGQDLAGFSLTMRRSYLVQGIKRQVQDPMDAALSPEFQGRGVQSAIARLSDVTAQADPDAEFNVWLGVPHPAWRRPKSQTSSRPVANGLASYTKLLTLTAPLHRKRTRPAQLGSSRTRDVLDGKQKPGPRTLIAATSAQVRLFARRLTSRNAAPHPFEIDTVESFGPEADQFWDEAAGQFDFIQVRDRDYLNWRYCDRRAGPFVVRIARDQGRMVGFVALRVGPGEAVIADLLALPGQTPVAEALLDDALAIARQHGSPTTRVWLQRHHPYADAVRRRGFFEAGQGLTMSVRPLHIAHDALRFFDNPEARLHVMLGDTDHV